MHSISDFDVPFTFERRPDPVPAYLRADLRIAILVLVLAKCCRFNRSTIFRLHVFNWALGSKQGKARLLGLINGTLQPGDVIIRYEPSLNRAVSLAVGERLLVNVGGNRVQLTDDGQSEVDIIERSDSLLEEEKAFLETIGYSVTEKFVERIQRGW